MDKYALYLDWLDSQYEEMYKTLFELADINSSSYNVAGLNQVLNKLIEMIEPLEGTHEIIPQKSMQQVSPRGKIKRIPIGNALRVRKRPEAPLQIFLGCHMDTVFPVECSFQKTEHLEEENIVKGPGVADLKGGIIVMLKALEVLERSPWAENIGWEILFNSDEEIGSPSSAELLVESAKRCDIGLLYEPAFPDGNLASKRKGSGNFTAVARGKAAHVGREFHEGRNAIRAIVDFIKMIDDLNGKTDEITINPGFIHGGGAVNMVPDLAMHRFNIRIQEPENEKWIMSEIENAVKDINKQDGIHIELYGRITRKPKLITDANQYLFDLIKNCGNDLGMNLDWHSTGGCCDGNNLAVAGLPNIDNLGVRGGKIHSSEEFMYPESLVERARLSALLLLKLANKEIKWDFKK